MRIFIIALTLSALFLVPTTLVKAEPIRVAKSDFSMVDYDKIEKRISHLKSMKERLLGKIDKRNGDFMHAQNKTLKALKKNMENRYAVLASFDNRKSKIIKKLQRIQKEMDRPSTTAERYAVLDSKKKAFMKKLFEIREDINNVGRTYDARHDKLIVVLKELEKSYNATVVPMQKQIEKIDKELTSLTSKRHKIGKQFEGKADYTGTLRGTWRLKCRMIFWEEPVITIFKGPLVLTIRKEKVTGSMKTKEVTNISQGKSEVKYGNVISAKLDGHYNSGSNQIEARLMWNQQMPWILKFVGRLYTTQIPSSISPYRKTTKALHASGEFIGGMKGGACSGSWQLAKH